MLKTASLLQKNKDYITSILSLLVKTSISLTNSGEMKLRFIIISISLFLSFSVYAQVDVEDKIIESPENLEIESVLDSIQSTDSLSVIFPAYELYKNFWNNTNIRYPSAGFADKNDTIIFTLVGFGESPYYHPHKGKVISKYGPRHGRMHTGTDIKLLLGDSVHCAFDGKVRLAKRFSGYGNLVLVRHNNGLETLYAHLKTISVKVNDDLKAGDIIGLGGRTGRATTEHLHFETRIFGDPFDSNKYIDFENFTLRSNNIYYINKKIFLESDLIKFDNPIQNTNTLLASNPDSLNSTKISSSSNSKSFSDQTPEPIKHVISKGDNLWSISKKYQTTIKNICELNKIYTNQVLKIGTILYIR
jgi:murein DD-endopeptidase MepM/ murein hydrolase activator NlpD/LysM repeat protein